MRRKKCHIKYIKYDLSFQCEYLLIFVLCYILGIFPVSSSLISLNTHQVIWIGTYWSSAWKHPETNPMEGEKKLIDKQLKTWYANGIFLAWQTMVRAPSKQKLKRQEQTFQIKSAFGTDFGLWEVRALPNVQNQFQKQIWLKSIPNYITNFFRAFWPINNIKKNGFLIVF